MNIRIVTVLVGWMILAEALALAESPYQVAWTRQFGTSGSDEGCGVAVDASGNALIAGYTDGILGDTSQGASDAFLVKCDASGVQQWTRQFGTYAFDTGRSVTVDADGNPFVVGYTKVNGNYDAVLSKYNTQGAPQWTKLLGLGVSANDYGESVAVDVGGNVFISGSSEYAGVRNAFLSKYTASGTLKWTSQLAGASHSVSVDALGNAYMSGTYYASPSNDAFLAKYDAAGSLLWTRRLGSANIDSSNAVVVDVSGNAFICGSTSGDLGGTNQGSNDVFLSKYDTSGVLQWTKQLGTSGSDDGYGLALDTDGNLFICGNTSGDLGGTNQGGYDLFVAKYDASGNLLWTQQLGTSNSDYCFSLVLDSANNAFIAGKTFGDIGGTNQGSADAFLIKLSPVPEPGAITLLIAAAMSFLAHAWRQRRASAH
jgi:hypothetical protein